MSQHDLNNLIEKINPSTYRFKLAGDDVEIGDIKSSEFNAHMKLKRWGEECFFGIHLPIKIVKYVLEENKVKAQTTANLMEIHFYPLNPEPEEDFGGAEFEVILKKKPSKNSIILDIETQGLKFYYQPPLTQEEIDEGRFRPENVVGSYAVYHATRGNIHKSGTEAEKYKCGKVFHLYRPRLTDADGNQTWAELNLDEMKGTLTITVDQSWLDNAVYPVMIDPDFGYTTKGGSSTSIDDIICGSKFTMGSIGGVANRINARTFGDMAPNVKCAIYASDLDMVANGITEELTPIPADAGWFQFNFTGTKPNVLASTNYILVAWGDKTHHTADICYDTGDANQGGDQPETYNNFPDSLDGGFLDNTNKFSIFCSYIPTGYDEFGHHKIEALEHQAYNKIIGWEFTTGAQGGTAKKIFFYGQAKYANAKARCALYKDSDGSFVAGTPSIAVTTTKEWKEHVFSGSPQLEASTTYLIVVWFSYWDSNINYVVDAGAHGYEGTHTYSPNISGDPPNDWPDNIQENDKTKKYSIYCLYETVAPPTYIPKVIMVTCSPIAKKDGIYRRLKNLWVSPKKLWLPIPPVCVPKGIMVQ